MRIELSEGEAVVVTFRGTDGEITVAFKPEDVQILTGCREDVARELPYGISVHTDMPDTANRVGLIYNEPLATRPPKEGVPLA